MLKFVLAFLSVTANCSSLEWKSVDHPDFIDYERCLFYDAYNKTINLDVPVWYALLRIRYEGVPVDIKYWISVDDLPKIVDESIEDCDSNNGDWYTTHQGHNE